MAQMIPWSGRILLAGASVAGVAVGLAAWRAGGWTDVVYLLPLAAAAALLAIVGGHPLTLRRRPPSPVQHPHRDRAP